MDICFLGTEINAKFNENFHFDIHFFLKSVGHLSYRLY